MTPFSKVKTWIKQGFYEKLPSSKSLRGALDLEQEIMDTLVRKGLATTEDCCTYTVVTEDSGPGYLVYTALLSQTGTNAPVATVLENTLGGTVVWSYSDVGLYIATLAGAFTENKTGIFLGSTVGSISAYQLDINSLSVGTGSYDGTPTNDYLYFTIIEIRVYP